jgi:proteasome lid subunit RPN8/RPN11
VIERLLIPTEVLVQIEDEARSAYPRECCGLLVGQWNGNTAEVFLAHPALNIAERDDRFEIHPGTQFAVLRGVRGTGREIVGCYHSHPNGGAKPSSGDAVGASEAGLVWLIAGVAAAGPCTIKAFLFSADNFALLKTCQAVSAQSARC